MPDWRSIGPSGALVHYPRAERVHRGAQLCLPLFRHSAFLSSWLFAHRFLDLPESSCSCAALHG
jgi:hypothetical protein